MTFMYMNGYLLDLVSRTIKDPFNGIKRNKKIRPKKWVTTLKKNQDLFSFRKIFSKVFTFLLTLFSKGERASIITTTVY